MKVQIVLKLHILQHKTATFNEEFVRPSKNLLILAKIAFLTEYAETQAVFYMRKTLRLRTVKILCLK